MKADELKRHLPSTDAVAADLYGMEWRGNKARCPFTQRHAHGDRDPSARYDQQKDRIFCASQKCFGDKGADAIALVMLMDNLPFTDAIRKLGERYGVNALNGHGTKSPTQTVSKEGGERKISATYIRSKLESEGWRLVQTYGYGGSLRKLRFEHLSQVQEGKGRPEKTCRWEYLESGQWWSGDGGMAKQLYVNAEFANRDQVEFAIGLEGENKADAAGQLGFAAFSFKELEPGGSAATKGRACRPLARS
ncbi:MAG TPA: hypothetical protein VM120_01510 [Bryobacteraceae bacterium]|nr:hypothetical protein [Bryobacteraceae bacterium]